MTMLPGNSAGVGWVDLNTVEEVYKSLKISF